MPERTMAFNWSDLGISGVYNVRNAWKQQDIGKFDSVYTAEVPFHGVVLVKLSR